MYCKYLFFLFCFLASLLCVLAVPPIFTEYDNEINFSHNWRNFTGTAAFLSRHYVVYWTLREPYIDFGVVCETVPDGWCGFGISVNGRMFDAGSPDLVVASATNRANHDGITYFPGVVQAYAKGDNPTGFSNPFTTDCPNADFGTLNGICYTEDLMDCGADNIFNATVEETSDGGTSYLKFNFTRFLEAQDQCGREISITAGDPTYIIFSNGECAATPNTTGIQQHIYVAQDTDGVDHGTNSSIIYFGGTTQPPTTAAPTTAAPTTTPPGTTLAPTNTTPSHAGAVVAPLFVTILCTALWFFIRV